MDPDNPYIYYDLARISEQRADLAGARALYERAIALKLDRRPGVDARNRLAALRRGVGVAGDLRSGRTSAPMPHWGGDRPWPG